MVAFDIALNTLSPSLSTIVKEAEKIINALNNLQLNECAVLKPFTTISLRDNDAEKKFVDAADAALRSTGISQLWTTVKQTFEASNKPDQAAGISRDITVSDVISGCPTTVQNLIMSGGSFLTFAGQENPDLAFFVPYIRAYMGDVKVELGTSAYNFVPIPKCPEAEYQMLKDGKLYTMTGYQPNTCRQESTTLRDKIATIMLNALTAIQNKGATSRDYENLVKMSPIAVHAMLRYGLTSGDKSVIDVVADPVAKGAFYQATLDLIQRADAVIGYLENVAKREYSTAGNQKPCNVSVDSKEAVRTLRENLREFANSLRQQYMAAVNEVSQIANYASLYQHFEEIVYDNISKKFGNFVAQRVLSK